MATYGVCAAEVEGESYPFVNEFHVCVCADGGDGLGEERGRVALFVHLLLDEGVGLADAVVELAGHLLRGLLETCPWEPGRKVFHCERKVRQE